LADRPDVGDIDLAVSRYFGRQPSSVRTPMAPQIPSTSGDEHTLSSPAFSGVFLVVAVHELCRFVVAIVIAVLPNHPDDEHVFNVGGLQ
jgi:hypothetical protein